VQRRFPSRKFFARSARRGCHYVKYG
jgi:hypothetical protein